MAGPGHTHQTPPDSVLAPVAPQHRHSSHLTMADKSPQHQPTMEDCSDDDEEYYNNNNNNECNNNNNNNNECEDKNNNSHLENDFVSSSLLHSHD